MSVGVGSGDYAEFIPFVPPVGDGLFFVRGSWLALLADDSWAARGSDLPDYVARAINAYADDASNITVIKVENANPPTHHLQESSDGAATWTETTSGNFPAGTNTINTLVMPFRNTQFRVLVFEPTGGSEGGTKGGEYASPDGTTWTRTGRVAPKLFRPPTTLSNSDGWCATSAHAYYLMDTTPAGGLLALHVDTESGTPETQRLSRSGTVTGGTYTIQVGSDTSTALNVSDSAATVLAALQALPTWGSGGSASGSIAGDNLDITFPYIGPQNLVSINNGSVTGGGTIVVAHLTPGTAGIRMDDAGFAFNGATGMFGAIEADVAMILGRDPSFNTIIEKYINTAAPVVVTPGFLTVDDGIELLVSKDGTTWVGNMFDNSVSANRLFVTHNQGASWTKVGSTTAGTGGITDIVADPVIASKWWAIFVAGFTATLWASVDNGDTWTLVGDPIPGSGMAIPLGGKAH